MPVAHFSPAKEIHRLRQNGYLDEAIQLVIDELDFVMPSEVELASLAPGEDCAIFLDSNLPWSVAPRPVAERILALLGEGKLIIHSSYFIPNSAAVLRGEKASLVPANGVRMWGLPRAHRQPKSGFLSPHRPTVSLRLGPNADIQAIRKLATELEFQTT